MIISMQEIVEWIDVDKFVKTERGAGGFSHTGTK